MPALLEAPPPSTDPGTAPRDGSAPSVIPDPADRGRAWLNSLFAGEFTFSAVVPVALPPGERTAAEHAAASRAAGCRDLFIVHADPFAGERLIADVARAAADRVFVLSPNPVAADRIAERLLKCGVAVLRALADDENPVRPSSTVSKVTSAALGAARVDQAKRESATAVAAAEKRVAAFAGVAKAVARLAEVNEVLKGLDATVAERAARRDRVAADVADEADTPFAAARANLLSEHTEAAARLTAELHTAIASHAERTAALAKAKEHLAEASRKPGFLGRIFGGKPKPGAPEPADVEKQVHALEAEVATRAASVAELQKRVEAADAATATACEKLVADEVASRRAVCESAVSVAENERSRARAEAAALSKVIAAAVPNDDHTSAVQNLTAVRERVAESTRTAQEALTRALTEPRVVVGTPGCLGVDPVFAALPGEPPFGLLVLDRAEELPEAEFPRLARFAWRWVLVGETLPSEPRPVLNGALRAPRNGRPTDLPFVARVAKLLDRETWAVEGDRLVCRLSHLTPDQRRSATREPLADRPEIELRFTAADSDLPAEIAFPVTTALPDAKSFLFHALGEVLLRPCGEVVWKYEPDSITATWPATDTGRDVAWIDLEPGVREKIVGAGLFAYTAAVHFDPAAGWDAERAVAWLDQHLPHATSRFAALPRSSGAPAR